MRRWRGLRILFCLGPLTSQDRPWRRPATPAAVVKMTAVWSFPPLPRLIDQIRGVCEKELGHDELRRSCPRLLSTFYMCSATRAHNHELVGAPDQGARQNGSGTRSRSVGVTNPTFSPLTIT
jgi:hypothetical protein